jgi:voltage-gated potassium channel
MLESVGSINTHFGPVLGGGMDVYGPTVEYLVRLLIDYGSRYATPQWLGLIDVVAIIPSLLVLVLRAALPVDWCAARCGCRRCSRWGRV